MTDIPPDRVRLADLALADEWRQHWRPAIVCAKIDGPRLLGWLRRRHARGHHEPPAFLWLLSRHKLASGFSHETLLRLLDDSLGNLESGKTTYFGPIWL